MKPMDYKRCAECHEPSCKGCDNTLKLTRDALAEIFDLNGEGRRA